MNEILKLFLSSYTFKVVTLGCILLGVVSAIIGTFAVLKKESLLGDGISHASLAGICLAFLITGKKELYILLLGALIIGLICIFLIHYTQLKSKVKFDSALAIVLSTFFGLGVVLLALIQREANTNQAGLDKFIFGQAAAFLKKDIYFLIGIIILVLFVILLFWKELKLFSFDPEFAQTKGFSINLMTGILIVLLVISIVMGIQSVGVILMSTMLIAPPVAARQWTDKFNVMMILSGIFGAFSGITGSFISMYYKGLSTGPVIAIVASLIVFFSILFSPKKGILFSKKRTMQGGTK